MMEIWKKMETKCIDFACTEYNLFSLITYCWLTFTSFLVPVKYSLKLQIYLNRPKCWQLPPAHWACITVQLFEQATPFSVYHVELSEISLVHCNLWGVIQQRVYQPQLYNINELKCVYGVVQWHWLKHYWQCNWWVALASLSMSAAYNGCRPCHQTEIVNGPSGARIAYTYAMSEHRCFPKKD